MADFSSALEYQYHGGASAFVSVPFTWESQPGTPKAKFHRNPSRLPPLTPPPSYFYDSPKIHSRKKNSKRSLLHNIFPKMRSTSTTSRKASTPSSAPAFSSASPSSASSSSSSAYSTTYYSVPSSPVTPKKFLARGRSMSSPKGFVDSRIDHHDQYEDYDGSKFSTRGCYAPFIKLFLREFH